MLHCYLVSLRVNDDTSLTVTLQAKGLLKRSPQDVRCKAFLRRLSHSQALQNTLFISSIARREMAQLDRRPPLQRLHHICSNLLRAAMVAFRTLRLRRLTLSGCPDLRLPADVTCASACVFSSPFRSSLLVVPRPCLARHGHRHFPYPSLGYIGV